MNQPKAKAAPKNKAVSKAKAAPKPKAAAKPLGKSQPGGNVQALAAAVGDQGGVGLFALDGTGRLWINRQMSPGGSSWVGWVGGGMGQPVPGQALAFAGENDGNMMLAMTDMEGMVWTWGSNRRGGMDPWSGPGIGGQKFSLAAIAAGEQSGARGIQLVGADESGQIWGCYQMNPGADWSGWTRGLGTYTGGGPFPIGEVALAGQNNGCLMLMAESGGTVAAVPQLQPGGAWGTQSLLDSGGPAVEGICACQQGGSRGVQLWGLDRDPNRMGQIWTIFQDTAGGDWGTWQGPGFLGQPEAFLTLAASGQGNGCTMLLAVGITGNLWTIGQTSPGGGWGSWTQMPAPG